MARRGLRNWGSASFVAMVVALLAGDGNAASLDRNGEISLGMRTYANARIGTEPTGEEFEKSVFGASAEERISRKSKTFPYSPAGHLRQNRFFLELEWKHSLSRLQKEGMGPLAILNELPFPVRNLRYGITFRAEGDGLYDWGPSEFRTAEQWQQCETGEVRGCLDRNPATGYGWSGSDFADVAASDAAHVARLRRDLRRHGSHRSRLFQAYLEGDVGKRVWFRFGRQVLSWGETDAFRLIDNINPIDSSFGGFLVPLDERRMPLDMLRMTYRLGSIGPMYDTFIDVYGAVDNNVAHVPGTQAGSPWALPNTGVPGTNTLSIREIPSRNFSDMRGGGRFVFNVGDGTFSLAHYYTRMDIPTVQTFVKPLFPNKRGQVNEQMAFLDPRGDPRYSVQAIQAAPLTQITGATMTFAAPSLYSILRSEFAYFNDEARFTQAQLDPFIYHFYGRARTLDAPNEQGYRVVHDPSAPEALLANSVLNGACNAVVDGNNTGIDPALCRTTGGKRTGDSIKAVIGWDTNQFIRFLNSHQSFFISTQFFYQRLLGAAPKRDLDGRSVADGEVLPVTEFDTIVERAPLTDLGAVEPSFIRQPTNTFLQTLLIATSYRSGTIVPTLTFFYDWGGATAFVPAIQFIHDPFRFQMEYNLLNASTLKGGSGVSLVRDRDNVQFRLEYAI